MPGSFSSRKSLTKNKAAAVQRMPTNRAPLSDTKARHALGCPFQYTVSPRASCRTAPASRICSGVELAMVVALTSVAKP
jgi:hypothetical protein